MNDTGTGVPTIHAEDIIGGIDQVNDVEFIVHRHGVSLRYRVHVHDRMHQSRFTVEGFDPQRCQWNEVASILSTTYSYCPGADVRAQVTDPASALITSPHNPDTALKAASWQKIVHALTERVHKAFDWPL